MQGVGKRDIWGAGFLAIPGFNTSDGAMPQAIAENYWREDRTNAFYPAAYNMAGSNTGFNMQTQDRYLLNMSYFRIKNITLGYTLPAVWTKKVLINKARIYVACENFFTFDNLRGLPIDGRNLRLLYVQLYKLQFRSYRCWYTYYEEHVCRHSIKLLKTYHYEKIYIHYTLSGSSNDYILR